MFREPLLNVNLIVQHHDMNMVTAKMYEMLGPIFLAFLVLKNILIPSR